MSDKIKKSVHKTIVDGITSKIEEAIAKNKGKMPYGCVTREIADAKTLFPTIDITRDHINNALRRRKKKRVSIISLAVPVSAFATVSAPSTSKIGRLCEKRTRGEILNVRAAKNEICSIYKNELDVHKAHHFGINRHVKFPTGRLDEIINEVRKKRKLSEDVKITKKFVRQRISKDTVIVVTASGPDSPLAAVEPDIVKLILAMSEIREPLRPSRCLNLINDMIKGTPSQQKLIDFKTKSKSSTIYTPIDEVGTSYWQNFKKRYGHLLVDKKGEKFELDRDSWCTYTNFRKMYQMVETKMIEAGVAEKINEPVWMTKDGKVVSENNKHQAYGCKVSLHITHPEMVIMADEVGANTSQKGDGHVGGERYICGKGKVPQKKASKKDKHFTLLGLTLLTGDPLMCVIIFSGERNRDLIELGVDPFIEKEDIIGDVSDGDYVINNTGKGKLFPTGPECQYKGKTIPCMCRWSKNGSMTGEILKDVVHTLDTYQLFDRSNGKKPFFLLDGHGSRLSEPFVKYVLDIEHEWMICLGVPYGTSL